MRVIAGRAKRIPLIAPDGFDTRPTQDRTKETLFNMIQPYLADSSFLDLFSGSGAIGIEALSRGAREAVFVECGKEACDCITYNLKKTKLESDAVLLRMNVIEALGRLADSQKSFDCVFMDPPYNHQLEKEVLTKLAGSSLVHEDTIIIVEASLETDFSYLGSLGYELEKEKNYKTNKHVLITLK
ncbi:16S rRNA (guanine(966)-N(2))-methyltransferase RsmD [[Clostridium] polysaccharolyticum]|uniref:16S rRNA (Guanine(966)-N(2))-methyltransferase RsmD n=1 Tax=[Clostridium] polysaccharolyticum TaxID=29364 RepID=A0A1I0B1X5_9FIRM|nr:16S rRNA (guanine(966)-N(2))-methyltransferase RsmD [[Clostridium] polysaccharolyticum]SET00072.1 16S rRNA (guanine(966)-N(2))-methyltransferase RsmD [[Clostridium] polysaccharolyticum]